MNPTLIESAKNAGVDAEALLRELTHAQFGDAIPIYMGAMEGFCIVAALQLAFRHPQYRGEARDIAEGFARALQERIAALAGSNTAKVMEKGWEQIFDA